MRSRLITVVEGERGQELSPFSPYARSPAEVVRFESVVRLHALGNVVVINTRGDVILDSGCRSRARPTLPTGIISGVREQGA